MPVNFSIELKQLAEKGQLRRLVKALDLGNGEVEYSGKRVVDLTSWDYLSLSRHSKILYELHSSIDKSAAYVSSSRLLSGTRVAHLSLEERFAKFVGAESSLLFSSKNQAVFSLISSTCTEADTLIVDETVVGPVADAAYIVGCPIQSISFSGEKWSERLTQISEKAKSPLLYVESYSPLTGGSVPLQEILTIAANLKIRVIIDDSFAFGGIGLRGTAMDVLTSNLGSSVFAVVSSFGLGIPGVGGIIAGSRELSGYLVNRSRTFFSETPIPEYLAACSEAAIDIGELQSERRIELSTLASRITEKAKKAGYRARSDKGPIVIFSFDKPSLADSFSKYLLSRGFLAERISRGVSLSELSVVRLIVNSSLSAVSFERLLDVIDESKQKI